MYETTENKQLTIITLSRNDYIFGKYMILNQSPIILIIYFYNTIIFPSHMLCIKIFNVFLRY